MPCIPRLVTTVSRVLFKIPTTTQIAILKSHTQNTRNLVLPRALCCPANCPSNFADRKQAKQAANQERRRKMAPITHVIFDLDGTILDTETLYRLAYRKVCKRFGVQDKLTRSLEAKLSGQSAMQVAHIMRTECCINLTTKELRKELDSEIRPILSQASLKPGAAEVIEHLSSQGVPLALASSSRRKNANLKMSRHKKVFSKFSHMVFRDDEGVSEGKPSPDVFLMAAQKFTEPVPSENVLVFEDSVSGAEAAIKAGMQVVMIPEDEPHKDVSEVIDSLEDFVPEKFGLPSFEESNNSHSHSQ